MFEIRAMVQNDFEEVLGMMRVFYDSPAVYYKASDDILKKDIEDCISDMPLIEGFVFDYDGVTAGYAMVAKCYATEFGGMCLWIEDIYIKPEYRHKGISGQFFDFIENIYKGRAVRLKLEAETENVNAIEAYKKRGFHESPYLVMTKEL